jgi:hypothetical protein
MSLAGSAALVAVDDSERTLMRLAAQYSHRNGLDEISRRYASLLAEMHRVINATHVNDSEFARYATNDERFDRSGMVGEALGKGLSTKGWMKLAVSYDSPPMAYLGSRRARRYFPADVCELDFVKLGLGVEVQFGKPSLPICSVCAKMTIFHNLGHIDCGVEIVPVKALALEMSSGVSYFEQFVWDLRQRGVADIDIPVLILGIDA